MIDSYEFGRFIINGRPYNSDIKLMKGGVIKYWNYVKHHKVTLKDVEEIFRENPDYVVIGTGKFGAVSVEEEVGKAALEAGIKLMIKPTEDACKKYNELIKLGKNTSAIMHATC